MSLILQIKKEFRALYEIKMDASRIGELVLAYHFIHSQFAAGVPFSDLDCDNISGQNNFRIFMREQIESGELDRLRFAMRPEQVTEYKNSPGFLFRELFSDIETLAMEMINFPPPGYSTINGVDIHTRDIPARMLRNLDLILGHLCSFHVMPDGSSVDRAREKIQRCIFFFSAIEKVYSISIPDLRKSLALVYANRSAVKEATLKKARH